MPSDLETVSYKMIVPSLFQYKFEEPGKKLKMKKVSRTNV